MAVLVHVESLERAILIFDLHKAGAPFHQASGQEQPVAETAAIEISRVELLGGGNFGLVRSDDFWRFLLSEVEGGLHRGIHHRAGFFQGLEVLLSLGRITELLG